MTGSSAVTRRELLELSPLAALGAFTIPSWREGCGQHPAAVI